MVKRIGGKRRHTRYKLQRAQNMRGKVRITAFMQQFKDGEKVALVADSSVAAGMFHPRFHGKTGTIVSAQGKSYQVQIRDRTKDKVLVIHPVHLKRIA